MRLGDRAVGWVDGQPGGSTFSFDASYLDAPDRPVLGQWFEDRLETQSRFFKTAVPHWFQNLLPERGGRVRRRIARQIGCAEEDDAAFLSALGGDLPGAVRVAPSGFVPPLPASIVREPHREPSPALRASLGGMQLKFTLSGSPDRLTLPVLDEVGVGWILKVSTETDLPRLAQNEAAVSRWLRAAGFEVPDVHVVPRDGFPEVGELSPETRWGFLIQRYDRTESTRIHQEDFLQVLGQAPTAKYDGAHALGLGCLVRQTLGQPGVAEYLRRMVAVVATGNADAHLKNWSLLYRDGVRATFAPLYDQVATIAFADLGRRLALRLGNAQDFAEVTPDAFGFVGGKLGADRVDTVLDDVLTRLTERFVPEEHGFDISLVQSLKEHWDRVPLLSARGLVAKLG